MFDSLFPKHWTTLQRLMWLKTNALARAVYETITGNPVTFTALAAPLRKLQIAFSPVQDLNGHDSPWPAGGGKNKFDPSAMPTPASTIQYHAFYVGDGTWTASSDCPYVSGNATVFFLAGNVSSGASTSANGISPTTGRTQTAVDGYVTVAWRLYSDIDPQDYHIQIEAGSTITNWTPYSNICPISGWDSLTVEQRGVNMWDEETEVGGIQNSTGQNVTDNNALRTKDYTPVKPNTEYCIVNGAKTVAVIFFYRADNTFISNASPSLSGGYATFTTPADCAFLRFKLTSTYGTTYNHNISINYPSTDHDYHAYNPSSRTISISLGSTVYSGWVDAVTGIGEVTWAAVDMGSLDWSYTSPSAGIPYGYFDVTNIGYKPTGGLMCSCYKVVPSGWAVDKTIRNHGSIDKLYVIDGSYDNKNSFKQAVTGQYICYELATPLAIQLTPQEINSLAGDNVMFTPCDSLTVEYRSN